MHSFCPTSHQNMIRIIASDTVPKSPLSDPDRRTLTIQYLRYSNVVKKLAEVVNVLVSPIVIMRLRVCAGHFVRSEF